MLVTIEMYTIPESSSPPYTCVCMCIHAPKDKNDTHEHIREAHATVKKAQQGQKEPWLKAYLDRCDELPLFEFTDAVPVGPLRSLVPRT
jgi:hypothetical protein